MTTFAISWNEFNSSNELVAKSKEFKNAKLRDSFIAKIMAKDNFNDILAYSDPTAPVETPETVPPVETPSETPNADKEALTGPVAGPEAEPKTVTRRSIITQAASILVKSASVGVGNTAWTWTTALDFILEKLGQPVTPDDKKYKALRRAIRREALTGPVTPAVIERLKLK